MERVTPYTLDKIWKELPAALQQDEDLKSKLPCFEHYNNEYSRIHIDGPAPAKSRCRVCKRNTVDALIKDWD